MRKPNLLLFSMMLLLCSSTWSQKAISGKVTHSRLGTPVPGVSVVVKGTNSGTVTDADGNYSLTVPDKSTTLVFSAVGFTLKEGIISGSTLDLSLDEGETLSLQEVVVVGFGTKIKKDLTGNIARIKGEEVINTPVPNLTQAIQGRAAGVFVEANNGKVGEGVKVRIRGAGSISASNDPLYVIDGIPINTGGLRGNPLADINFNDIETFDILKDASAAAIYGSRAAGGVVLITTKKGKQGRTKINVNMQYGSNKPTNHRRFLNAAEYVELIREAAINSDIIEGVDPAH